MSSKIQFQNHELRLEATGKDSILVQYLGCGGFYLKQPDRAILIDPFFSNTGPLMFLPLKKLQSNTTQIAAFFKENFKPAKDDSGSIKALLLGHAHYDHMLDVPTIFQEYLQRDSTQIMGSLSAQYLLQLAGIANNTKTSTFKDLNAIAWKPYQPIRYVYTRDRRIRVLPIVAAHAPHILGIKMLKAGPAKKKLRVYPDKVSKFPEGTNFSFLIDFLDTAGNIDFRIFSQASSVCHPPTGFPPKTVLAEKPVDLMLLCVASYNQATDYPARIIKHINPRHIMLAHWENFFQKREKLLEKPRVVPFTSLKRFMKELEVIQQDSSLSFGWTLPQINISTLIIY